LVFSGMAVFSTSHSGALWAGASSWADFLPPVSRYSRIRTPSVFFYHSTSPHPPFLRKHSVHMRFSPICWCLSVQFYQVRVAPPPPSGLLAVFVSFLASCPGLNFPFLAYLGLVLSVLPSNYLSPTFFPTLTPFPFSFKVLFPPVPIPPISAHCLPLSITKKGLLAPAPLAVSDFLLGPTDLRETPYSLLALLLFFLSFSLLALWYSRFFPQCPVSLPFHRKIGKCFESSDRENLVRFAPSASPPFPLPFLPSPPLTFFSRVLPLLLNLHCREYPRQVPSCFSPARHRNSLPPVFLFSLKLEEA